MTQIHPEHSPDASVHGNHAPVQTTRIEISERTLTILALAFGCIAIMGGFWSISEAQKAERESRMLQYYVLEMDAKLIAAGIKKPDESVAQQQEKRK